MSYLSWRGEDGGSIIRGATHSGPSDSPSEATPCPPARPGHADQASKRVRVHLYSLSSGITHRTIVRLVDATSGPEEPNDVFVTKLGLGLGRGTPSC